jgi:hypothetical protein
MESTEMNSQLALIIAFAGAILIGFIAAYAVSPKQKTKCYEGIIYFKSSNTPVIDVISLNPKKCEIK